jgi:TonB family protein
LEIAKKPADFVPNQPEGEHTELNAWQWRHAPFFNRIKARISEIWSPQAQISRFDPQGTLLGQEDRVTVVKVTIDRQGHLRNLAITEKSGVGYLDDEAARAFKEASPFLYPPKELFEQSDEFSFNFAFHLYINRGFSINFDWQN